MRAPDRQHTQRDAADLDLDLARAIDLAASDRGRRPGELGAHLGIEELDAGAGLQRHRLDRRGGRSIGRRRGQC